MNRSSRIYIFVSILIVSLSLQGVYIRFIYAILYENGTCANSNVTKGANQGVKVSQLNEEYFKNLTRDNRQLAELICQNILNETS
jgi:hypothetical protein